MRYIKAFFDGSCIENPGGPGGWGFVVLEDEILATHNGKLGTGLGMTNNVAEYEGLIATLKYLVENHQEDYIEIFGDSKMVINMVNNVWGKKNPHKKVPHLKPLLAEAIELFNSLENVSFSWIPREENQLADFYSKL